ncbi:hypothetical protein D3C78_1755200 [compost metagenome]
MHRFSEARSAECVMDFEGTPIQCRDMPVANSEDYFFAHSALTDESRDLVLVSKAIRIQAGPGQQQFVATRHAGIRPHFDHGRSIRRIQHAVLRLCQ